MIIKSVINILRSAKPFRFLDPDELDTVIHYGQLIHYSNKDVILTQGQAGRGLFIIVKGRTMVAVKVLGRGEIKLANLVTESFFGEVNLLGNTPCTATVKSIGQSTCFLFDKHAFEMLSIAFPRIRFRINQALVEDVITRETTMIAKINSAAKNRQKNVIKLAAQQHQKAAIQRLRIIEKNKVKQMDILATLPVFKTVSPTELKYLIHSARIITVKKQGSLFNKPSQRLSYFLILAGSIKVGVASRYGVVKIAVFGPHTLFCSTAIINENVELFIHEACEDATLLELTHDAIQSIENKYLSLWYIIQDVGYRYIVSLQQKLNSEVIRISCETT